MLLERCLWKVRRWLGPNTLHLNFELALWLSMSLLTYATLWNYYGMHHAQASNTKYGLITIAWLSRHLVYRIVCTTGYAHWWSWVSAGHYFDVPHRSRSNSHLHSYNRLHRSNTNVFGRLRSLLSFGHPSAWSWSRDYWKYAPPLQWCVAVVTSVLILVGYCNYYQDQDDFIRWGLGITKTKSQYIYDAQPPSAFQIFFRLSWWNTIMSILIYGRLVYPMLDLKKSVTDTSSYKAYYADAIVGGSGGGNAGNLNSSSVSTPILGSSNKHNQSTTFVFFSLIYGSSYTQQWMQTSLRNNNNYTSNRYANTRWAEHYQSIKHPPQNTWKLHWHIVVLRVLEYMFAVAFLPTTSFACKATGHCDLRPHVYYHIHNQNSYYSEKEHSFLAPGAMPSWLLPYMIFTFAASMLLAQMWTLDRSNIGWSILSNKVSSDNNSTNNNGFSTGKHNASSSNSKQRRRTNTSSISSTNSTSPRERNDRRILTILQSLWSEEMIGAPSSSQLLYQLKIAHAYHAIGLLLLVVVYFITNYYFLDTGLPPPVMPILFSCLTANHLCRFALTHTQTKNKEKLVAISKELSANYDQDINTTRNENTDHVANEEKSPSSKNENKIS